MSVYRSIHSEGATKTDTPTAGIHPAAVTLPVHQYVQERAAATPDVVAVSAGERKLTFGELWRSSTSLALALSAAGVRENQVVGVHLDRSPEAVVANLGILRSGGAYLPLDPSLPSERLAFVLRDSGARHVVTNAALAPHLPATHLRVIEMESLVRESVPGAFVGPAVGPRNLAYVIYTSGSTGEPKGVEITHEGLTNLVSWHCRNFNVTPSDRAAHMAPIGFDAAVWEVWPYLCAGASLHIPDASLRGNPEGVRDWILSQGITMAFLPTPMAEKVMALDWPTSTSLRSLLTGADTLYQRPRASLPFAVINNYGPTECSVVATSGRVLPADIDHTVPSIGSPIDGITVHILDDQLQAVVPGQTGEIYLGGAGLARGYRNRSDLTRRSFIERCVSGKTHRLYRTGDLARLRPDGQIEFLGRTDEQMKIRGHRVEPSEIVRALHAHPAIQAAAVIPHTEKGEKRIYAYIVRRPEHQVQVENLFEHLRRSLPDYMLPSGFIDMASLPVGANGKLDRSALPQPSSANLLRDEDFSSPSTIIEGQVAVVLAQLLHIEQVGRTDNFFLLGGHSLLGTQLITRIEEIFGVQITLLSLFDHPTVAGIAEQIEKAILAKLHAEGQYASPNVQAPGQERSS